MLEDATVPTGYEGHRLKELARCSVVVCFSPGNCVLRYDRPSRRHKQAINANTRSWFNERDGVEALGHLMKRLSYCGHTRTKILLQGWRISSFASFSFLPNNPTMEDKQCQALHIALRPECFEEKTRQCIPAQLQSIMFTITWRKLLGCVFLLCLLLVHLLWWEWFGRWRNSGPGIPLHTENRISSNKNQFRKSKCWAFYWLIPQVGDSGSL